MMMMMMMMMMMIPVTIGVTLYVMGGGSEQRVPIKFCLKAGLSATETIVLVQKAYWTEDLNRSQTFLGGILDFGTEGRWQKMTRELAVQTRLELR
jgi:hypothetical protein